MKTKVSKKRLNNLLMILLLTVVLLIMSTYAWFTANKIVKIDAIDVTVATSSGLQISADAKEWKTVLTKDDVIGAYNEYGTSINQFPSVMQPVSTVLELDDNGHIKMFFGDVKADMDTTSDTYSEFLLSSTLQTDQETNGIAEDGGYYMVFDVFLKVEEASNDLYMTGTVTEPTTEKGIANAARLALVKGPDVVATDADPTEAQKLTTAGGTVTMWEPNVDSHTLNGVNNAAALGWASLTAGEGNPVVEYDGVKADCTGIVLADATEAKNPDYFAGVTPTEATPKTGVPNIQIDGGLATGITKLRLYFWVEGQDVDCENNASGTDVQFDVSFGLSEF